MTTYFKAVRPDGTDFFTGTIDYAAALGGEPVTLPEVSDPECCTGSVLHASTVPAETLIVGSWPCRLFEVIGTPVAEKEHKRGFFSLTVVREIDAHRALGPQGEQIAALIDRAGKLTEDEAEKLGASWGDEDAEAAAEDSAAWAAARDAARYAARYAAANAARYAAEDTARYAAEDAALALVVRDLISKEHYDLLTAPWAQAIGPAHPDDETTTGRTHEH